MTCRQGVTITEPSDGDTVAGIIAVTADVMDDNGFLSIDFLLDGRTFAGITADRNVTEDTHATLLNTEGYGDGIHELMVIIKDTIGQTGSDEIRIIINNGSDLPQDIMAPVAGMFHIDNDTQTLPPDDWSFWQHMTGSHTAGGGIGNSNDTSAWNINLENDADAGKSVYSVAVGVVTDTYAGCEKRRRNIWAGLGRSYRLVERV